MAGFILGTGSGVLAAAATYYTLSTHLHRDTDALREELERANRTIDTSFNPSHPAAPVSYIGPSRNPYEPTFGEQLRLKWNRAVESGLENVRETDWTAVGAGVVQGGKDIVGRLNGEVPATTTTPAAHLPTRDDIRETLDGAKDAIYRGEKKMEHAAEDAVQSVQDAATTAGRSVANSSASLLERLTGAFAGAKSRTDDAVARAQQEAGHLAGEAKDEARHLSNATSNAAHRTADAARHAGLSLRDDARQVGSHANNAAHRAAGAAKDAGLSLREEAHHVGSVADDAAHRAASAAKDAGLSLRDEARHFGNAADNAAHQAAATAKHAGLSLRDEARHVSHVAEDAASRAASSVADTARSAGQTIQTEARHLANVTEDAAHRAAASVRETAHDIKDTISPPPPSTAQRLYDGVKDTITGAVHAVEDKGEEMKQATDNKVNRMMAEKKLKGGLEEYHEGILKGASGVGVISGNGLDVNKESFTGGNNLKVRASRKAEGSVMGRLV